jgi:cell fate (sporulation/competence/biofilm development) regulator YmcA (YheA/YmcA/DUF963 family)
MESTEVKFQAVLDEFSRFQATAAQLVKYSAGQMEDKF